MSDRDMRRLLNDVIADIEAGRVFEGPAVAAAYQPVGPRP